MRARVHPIRGQAELWRWEVVASCERHCVLSNLVAPPDICDLFLPFLWSVASIIIRDRGIVCGVSSIVFFSNYQPCVEKYRVSLFIRSRMDQSCHFLVFPLDIDECSMFPLCYNGRCENMPGMFRCACDEGFQLDKQGTNCTGESSDKFFRKKFSCFNRYLDVPFQTPNIARLFLVTASGACLLKVPRTFRPGDKLKFNCFEKLIF